MELQEETAIDSKNSGTVKIRMQVKDRSYSTLNDVDGFSAVMKVSSTKTEGETTTENSIGNYQMTIHSQKSGNVQINSISSFKSSIKGQDYSTWSFEMRYETLMQFPRYSVNFRTEVNQTGTAPAVTHYFANGQTISEKEYKEINGESSSSESNSNSVPAQ